MPADTCCHGCCTASLCTMKANASSPTQPTHQDSQLTTPSQGSGQLSCSNQRGKQIPRVKTGHRMRAMNVRCTTRTYFSRLAALVCTEPPARCCAASLLLRGFHRWVLALLAPITLASIQEARLRKLDLSFPPDSTGASTSTAESPSTPCGSATQSGVLFPRMLRAASLQPLETVARRAFRGSPSLCQHRQAIPGLPCCPRFPPVANSPTPIAHRHPTDQSTQVPRNRNLARRFREPG